MSDVICGGGKRSLGFLDAWCLVGVGLVLDRKAWRGKFVCVGWKVLSFRGPDAATHNSSLTQVLLLDMARVRRRFIPP